MVFLADSLAWDASFVDEPLMTSRIRCAGADETKPPPGVGNGDISHPEIKLSSHQRYHLRNSHAKGSALIATHRIFPAIQSSEMQPAA